MNSVEVRFLDKLQAPSQPDGDGCWRWLGAINTQGYGLLWHGKRTERAHRVSYELYAAPIPEGMEIDHLCGVHDCVNPAHVRIVPHGFNGCQGGATSAAIQQARTQCKSGHPFSGDNLRVSREGWRKCRTCDRRLSRQGYARRKARRELAHA